MVSSPFALVGFEDDLALAFDAEGLALGHGPGERRRLAVADFGGRCRDLQEGCTSDAHRGLRLDREVSRDCTKGVGGGGRGDDRHRARADWGSVQVHGIARGIPNLHRYGVFGPPGERDLLPLLDHVGRGLEGDDPRPLDRHGHGVGLDAASAPGGGEVKFGRLAHLDLDRARGGFRGAQIDLRSVRLQFDGFGMFRLPGDRNLLTPCDRRVADFE